MLFATGASSKYGVIVDGFVKEYYEQHGYPDTPEGIEKATTEIQEFCLSVKNLPKAEFDEYYELYFTTYGSLQPKRRKKKTIE